MGIRRSVRARALVCAYAHARIFSGLGHIGAGLGPIGPDQGVVVVVVVEGGGGWGIGVANCNVLLARCR
jgi:hypothetical protein